MKKKLYELHEEEFAAMVPGGQQTIASGRLPGEKHDVQTRRDEELNDFRFLYELKCTQQKGYRFEVQAWQQLTQDALTRDAGMRPAWAIRFYDPETKVRNWTIIEADLVVLGLDDFVELLEEVVRLRGQAKA